MAVLAVAFVVLAAVPVALTDSDADTATDVKTVSSNTVAKGWYYIGESTTISTNSASAGEVNIILKKDADVVLTYTQTVAINVYMATGDLTTEKKCAYDAASKVVYAGTTNATISADSNGKYYTLNASALGTITEGVLVKTTSATLYSLSGFTGATLSTAEQYVEVDIPGITTGTAAQKIAGKEVKFGAAVVKLTLSEIKSTAPAVATKVTLTAGTTDQFKIGDSDKWVGKVEVTAGSITKTDTMVTTTGQEGMYLPGVLSDDVVKPIAEPNDVAAGKTYVIKAGTSVSKEMSFVASSVTYVTLSSDFTAVADISMGYTEGAIADITLGTTDVSSANRAAWSGTITFKESVKFGGSSVGKMKLDGPDTGGADKYEVQNGVTLTVYGDISGGKTITTADAATAVVIAADADIGKITLAYGKLEIDKDVTASAVITSAFELENLKAIKATNAGGDTGKFSINAAGVVAGSYAGSLTITKAATATLASETYYGNLIIGTNGSFAITDAGFIAKFRGNVEVTGGDLTAPKAVFLGEVDVAAGKKISTKELTVGINSTVNLAAAIADPATIAATIEPSAANTKIDVLGQIKGSGIIGHASNTANVAVGAEGSISSTTTKTDATTYVSYLPYYIIDNTAGVELSNVKKTIESIMNEQGYTRYFLKGSTAVTATPTSTGGSIELPQGIELYLGTVSSGTAIETASSLSIVAPTTSQKAITVTIPSGTKVYITSEGAIAVGKSNTLAVGGYLMIGKAGNTTITGEGTFEMVSGGAVQNGISVKTAKAVGYIEDAHIDGKTSGSLEFPLYQKVIVDEGKTFTISALNTVTINGTLEVLGTIVIEKDGELILGVDATTAVQGATVKIPGTIQIKEGGKLTINNASVDLSGSAVVAGQLLVDSYTNNSSTFTVKGSMTVESTGVLATATSGAKVSVSSTGILDINGYMGMTGKGLVIDNSGSVVIDNSSIASRSAGYTAEISLVAADATVTIDSMLIENATQLTITDAGLQVGKDNGKTYLVGSANGTSGSKITKATQNTITFSGAVGDKLTGQIIVSEAVESENEDSVTTYSNIMNVIGSVSNGTDLATGATELTTYITMKLDSANAEAQADTDGKHKVVGYIQIPEDSTLVIGKNITPYNLSGSLKVAGYLDMTAGKNSTLTNTGLIDVSGEIKINGAEFTGSGTINAAKFVAKEGPTSSQITYHVYEALNQAVVDVMDESNVNTDKSVVILGNIVVLEDVTVPEGVKVSFKTTNAQTSTLTVGSEDDNTVLMTVAEGASLTSGNGQVKVIGTLVFDNKTNDSTRNTVADVTITDSAEDGSITYTNIYFALSTATSGETVNVTRSAEDSEGNAQYVDLYASISIAEGVTLVVGSNAAPLYLEDGVTLYVNGTLKTEKEIYAEKQFSTSAKDSDVAGHTSAVIVSGQIQTAQSTAYGDSAAVSSGKDEISKGAPVYGAYYTIDGYNVISSMAVAQDNIAKITSDTITVNGPVSAGDLSFAKTSSTTVKTILVSGAQVTSAGSTTSNDVSSSLTVTSLTIDEAVLKIVKNGTFTGTVQNDSASVTATAVGSSDSTNGFQVIDKDGKLYLSQTASTAKGSTLSVATGTVYAGVNSTTAFTYATSSSISMKVASGATMEAVNATISHLDVAGTLVVDSSETLTVGTQLVVSGAVGIFAGDDSKAKANVSIKDTYIGTTKKGVTGAAAVFYGPVTATGVVVIASGSDVDEDAIDSFGTKKTEYYVEDALWITAYDNGSTATYIDAYKNVTITNGYFSGWNNSKGTATTATTAIGASGYDKVYAGATYEIYQIIIKADQGIGDLYLGGNIMSKGFIQGEIGGQDTQYYAYWATVKAGTYEVTCKLANGYSGTAVLKDSTGKDLAGNKLTVSGNEYNLEKITVNFQLTGIEKSGYVDPVEPQKEDNSLKVTDYLLIVLVILVVILAVIVALRLMRS